MQTQNGFYLLFEAFKIENHDWKKNINVQHLSSKGYQWNVSPVVKQQKFEYLAVDFKIFVANSFSDFYFKKRLYLNEQRFWEVILTVGFSKSPSTS